MIKYYKYLKCSKCGNKIKVVHKNEYVGPIVCTQPMPYRTSGICAGTYDIIISEVEYKEAT